MNAHIIQFVVLTLVGTLFDPMNLLVYNPSHMLISLPAFYNGLVMASSMIWSHELIHWLTVGHFNWTVFTIGIILSAVLTITLLRYQIGIRDRDWLKGMITHHSSALTTSHHISKVTNNAQIRELAINIIQAQEREIKQMESMLETT